MREQAWWLALGVALASIVMGYDSSARACSKVAPEEHVINSAQQAVDFTPPAPPTGVTAFVWRRQGTLCDDDDCVSSSCGDEAGVELSFTTSSDDQSAADQIGYRLQFRAGAVPLTLQLAATMRSLGKHTIPIAFDEAPQVDGEAELVAVDGAGNVSAPSAPFRVVFNGCTFAPEDDTCVEDVNPACSVALGAVGGGAARDRVGAAHGTSSPAPHPLFSFVALGLAAALRRSRSRPC